MHIIINDKLINEKRATISVKDRGFRFGDGVFETCLVKAGIIYNFEHHISRLQAGLLAIKIHFDLKKIKPFCYQLLIKNNLKNGFIRIAISRGIGSLGYLPKNNPSPTLVIETIKPNPNKQNPTKLMVSSLEKPSSKALPVAYKLMQGLNSILVKMEAVENNCFDGLILNHKRQICETSSANIFWIKNETLYTPHQDCGCLQGTIRQKIIQLSPIKVKLVKAKLAVLLAAEEVFITNVAIGVLAVKQIDQQEFISTKYSTIFANLLKEDIQKYAKQAQKIAQMD